MVVVSEAAVFMPTLAYDLSDVDISIGIWMQVEHAYPAADQCLEVDVRGSARSHTHSGIDCERVPRAQRGIALGVEAEAEAARKAADQNIVRQSALHAEQGKFADHPRATAFLLNRQGQQLKFAFMRSVAIVVHNKVRCRHKGQTHRFLPVMHPGLQYHLSFAPALSRVDVRIGRQSGAGDGSTLTSYTDHSMGPVKAVKHILLLAAALCFAAAPAQAQDVQQRFLIALSLMEQGQAAEAAIELQRLYVEAPTPRVRLELARALMLAERWQEAKQLFVEAFKDDPPPVVKANILNFISRIDRRRGKVSASLSAARYGNPLQQPGAYTLNFAGIELAYEPDQTYQNLWGVTVGGSYSKEYASGWQLAATASFRELPHRAADRVAGDVSFSRQVGTRPLEVKLGATRLGQQGQSFTLPYAQAAYAVPLTTKSAIRPTATVGYYAADVGHTASGWQAEVFVPFVYMPLPTQFVAAGPTVLRHTAGYGELTYTSLGLRAVGTLQTEAINLEVGAQGTITRFDSVDPFWGVRRKDKGLFTSAMVSSYKVRLGPFVPSVGITCSLNRSTASYYRQQGCDTQFEIRKIF